MSAGRDGEAPSGMHPAPRVEALDLQPQTCAISVATTNARGQQGPPPLLTWRRHPRTPPRHCGAVILYDEPLDFAGAASVGPIFTERSGTGIQRLRNRADPL